MARVGTYIFLPGTTAEAFEFYRSAFGTEFSGIGLMRYSDAPPEEGIPPEMADLVMHVTLPITGDHSLMGTDNPEVVMGDHASIMVMPDTREEADRLFSALSAGGTNLTPMSEMFWGDYWGSFTDKFGIAWQIDVEPAS